MQNSENYFEFKSAAKVNTRSRFPEEVENLSAGIMYVFF